MMNHPHGVPEILSPKGGDVKQVMSVLCSMSDFIGSVMQDNITLESVQFSQVLVRLFLTDYALFTKQLYPFSKKPMWCQRYNFMSLITLVDQMKEIGSPKDIWEGGYLGEGFLRYVKPSIKNGLRTGWNRALLLKLLRERTINYMCSDIADSDSKNGTEAAISYRIYKSHAQVLKLIHMRKPISVVVKTDCPIINAICICYLRNNTKFFEKLDIDENDDSNGSINKLTYKKYLLSAIEIEIYDETNNIVGGVLLPLLRNVQNGLSQRGESYTLITSDWIDHFSL
jgi:hypothetical protein